MLCGLHQSRQKNYGFLFSVPPGASPSVPRALVTPCDSVLKPQPCRAFTSPQSGP